MDRIMCYVGACKMRREENLMDYDEEYIKMCEKAVEVQELHKYKDGDFVVNFVTGKYQKPVVYTYGQGVPYESGDYAVWLPRQDQLQEMMEQPNIKILWGRFNWIFQKPGHDVPSYSERFTSLEQAWLAFVMFEKFGKKWRGNEWQ